MQPFYINKYEYIMWIPNIDITEIQQERQRMINSKKIFKTYVGL